MISVLYYMYIFQYVSVFVCLFVQVDDNQDFVFHSTSFSFLSVVFSFHRHVGTDFFLFCIHF